LLLLLLLSLLVTGVGNGGWRRMLETKCDDDEFEILVSDLMSNTNIQLIPSNIFFLSPTSENRFTVMLNYLIKTGNNCFFVWLSNFCPLEVPSDQNLNLLIVCRTDPARFRASILNSGSVTILQPALISA